MNEINAEFHMIEVCQDIGKVSECNAHFTSMLSQRINESGKSIEEFTVGELLALIHSCSEFYNRLFSDHVGDDHV